MRGSKHLGPAEAAILTVGTELAEGLRPDTNGPEVARALASAGFTIATREILPDDVLTVATRIRESMEHAALVVVTGGLGPTHDDVTREAASAALTLPLRRDAALLQRLEPVVRRHRTDTARANVLRQALVVEGARVLMPSSGTAPGQLIDHGPGTLVLLPGPPREMRPMLSEAIGLLGRGGSPAPRVLRCARMMESDAQVTAEEALSAHPGITLTVLASPSLLEVVLIPRSITADALDRAALDVAHALGPACYSTNGASLAGVVVDAAIAAGSTLALAESCTGGSIAAELTGVPGASKVFHGGAITYSDRMKEVILGVDPEIVREQGAVSEETAREMAEGVRALSGADIGLAVTGIAGPDGGTEAKPVGTVWIAIATGDGTVAECHRFTGDRALVRMRATVTALDLLRLSIAQTAAGGG